MKIESDYQGLISSGKATGGMRPGSAVESAFARELSAEMSQSMLDEMERASSLLSDQIVKMRARVCLFTPCA